MHIPVELHKVIIPKGRMMNSPKRIKWSHLRRLYEGLEPYLKALPMKLERPDSGRVLVLAAHIDDNITVLAAVS
jgi:hypothetical protein